jgi:hypothetical protein
MWRKAALLLGLGGAAAVKDTVCGAKGCAFLCGEQCGAALLQHPALFAERFGTSPSQAIIHPAGESDDALQLSPEGTLLVMCAAECNAFFDGDAYDGDKIRRDPRPDGSPSSSPPGPDVGVGGGSYDSAFVPVMLPADTVKSFLPPGLAHGAPPQAPEGFHPVILSFGETHTPVPPTENEAHCRETTDRNAVPKGKMDPCALCRASWSKHACLQSCLSFVFFSGRQFDVRPLAGPPLFDETYWEFIHAVPWTVYTVSANTNERRY